jgi:dTDP-4-dehydrorhamnose reductase
VTLSLLVVGARGQLGTALIRLCEARGVAVTGLTSSDVNLRNADAARRAVVAWARASQSRDMVVINAWAYNAVDAAEDDPVTARAINATGPGVMAAACGEVNARFVHVSTDYVFAGDASRPYEVDAPTGPLGIYGRSKLEGEQAVRAALPDRSYVVRTAALYGGVGHNFVKTMIRLESEREIVTVVNDQQGSPTWSRDLATGLLAIAESGPPAGIYHGTNGGGTTWHGFAQAVFEEVGADPERVRPITTEDFAQVAPRPKYSVLSTRWWDEAGLPPFRHWREALAEAFRTEGEGLRAGG